MPRTFRMIPWFSRREWLDVRNHIFDSDYSVRSEALDVLKIWKIRRPKLPTAVECTLTLCEVYIRDSKNSGSDNDAISESHLRMLYSTALMRFLNFATDFANRSLGTNSMFRHAKVMNIPEWIVSLRHDIAHSTQLPDLELLRVAVQKCVTWLYDNYWSDDSNAFQDFISKRSRSIHQLGDIIQISQELSSYKSQKFTNISNVARTNGQIEKRLNLIYEDHNVDPSAFVTLDDNLKILAKILARLVKDKKHGEYAFDLLINDDSEFLRSIEVNISKSRIKLKRSQKYAWPHIIHEFSKFEESFVPFLKKLILFESSYHQQTVTFLLLEIVASVRNIKQAKDMTREKSNKRDHKGKIVETDVTRLKTYVNGWFKKEHARELVILATKSPNKWTPILLKELMKLTECSLDECQKSQLFEIVNLYFGNNLTEKSKNNIGMVYTLETLTGENLSFLNNESEIENSSSNHERPGSNWSYADDDVDWKKCPLGVLPWQIETHRER